MRGTNNPHQQASQHIHKGRKEERGLPYSKDECALQLLGKQHKTTEREHRHHLMRHSKCLWRLNCQGLNDKYMLLVVEWFHWLPWGALWLPAVFHLSLKVLAANVVICLGCLLWLVCLCSLPCLGLDLGVPLLCCFFSLFLYFLLSCYISLGEICITIMLPCAIYGHAMVDRQTCTSTPCKNRAMSDLKCNGFTVAQTPNLEICCLNFCRF